MLNPPSWRLYDSSTDGVVGDQVPEGMTMLSPYGQIFILELSSYLKWRPERAFGIKALICH